MIEAESEITLFYVSEIDRTIRYYLLQATSANPPGKPTTYPPGGNWQTTEPEYIANSTNSLYFTDLTVLTNGDFSYSEVSKSSSYEAAKDAWNKVDSIAGDVTALKKWQVEASSLITKDGIINTVGSYYATPTLVDGVTTRVAEAESIIKQHSDSIEMTVQKDGVISAINQTSETVKISADKISLTAAGLVEIINAGTTKIEATKLNLTAKGIVDIINSGTTKIKASELELSAADVVNIINSGTTTISASKIDLSGYVTISGLATAGQTTVNGSNVTTGVIKSLNYKYTSGIYADSGAAIDLDKGLIVSKGFVVNGTTGEVFFKGKLEGPSGYIGGFNINGSDLVVDKSLANGATAKFTLSGTGSYGNMIEIYNGSLGKNVFTIDYLGFLHAEDASFGTISAGSVALTGGLKANGDIEGNLIGSASSMRNAGSNVIGMVISDTVTTWGKQLNSVHYINGESIQVITDAPSSYALIFNMTMESDIHQIWCTQPSGSLHHRGGNGNGWSGTWREIADSTNYAKITGERYSKGTGWLALTSYSGDNSTALGTSENRYTRLYAASASINTSDENEKDILSEITEPYEKLFMGLTPVLYMWKNFGSETKPHDRIHCGLGAQSMFNVAKKYGLSTRTLAAICRDDLVEPTVDGRHERWGIAYTELIPLNIHMTQKALTSIDSTRKEVSALESSMTARMESLQYQLAQAFDRIATLEKENKSLKQALG